MNATHIANLILGPPGKWRIVRLIVYTFTITALCRLVPIPGRRKRAPIGRKQRSRQMPWATSAVVVFTTLTIGASAVAGGVVYTLKHATPTMIAATGYQKPLPFNSGAPYVGVFEPEPANAYGMVSTFASVTGMWPGIVLSYTAVGTPFYPVFARDAASHHAIPFIQILPRNISMSDIAAGKDDQYFTSYAKAVHTFGKQVILGFAPEMNGNWYSWGAGHTSPAVFKAAWQHVVDVFRAAKATNVIWLWTVASSSSVANTKISPWWPGSNYVTWIGIDGYYYQPKETFNSIFGSTITQAHALGNTPVLISETAVGPHVSDYSQIVNLFQDVIANHLFGLVWFDQDQHGDLYHQDWRIEGRAKAVHAFRVGIRLIRHKPTVDPPPRQLTQYIHHVELHLEGMNSLEI
jgi:hypothetical protein